MNGRSNGVLRVSLVDAPAVESDFVAYSAEEPAQTYAIADESKRRVFGVVLRADYPMFRRDADGSEYYIVFRADQIRAFAQKYLAEGRQNEVDLNHDFKSVEGAEMVQFFIKDAAAGLAPAGFGDIADGSLFAEYQITDDALWERIRRGEFHGFSVEIIHGIEPIKDNISSKKNMSKLSKLKEAFAAFIAEAEAQNYGRIATDKGTIVWEGEDDLAEGMFVWAEDAEGNRVELEDGEYANEDVIIAVAGGKVESIRKVEAPEPEQPAEPVADAAEGEPAAEPAAEPAEDEKDKRIAELEAENAELRKRIAELEAKPAAEPAHEAFRKQSKVAENPFELMRKLK